MLPRFAVLIRDGIRDSKIKPDDVTEPDPFITAALEVHAKYVRADGFDAVGSTSIEGPYVRVRRDRKNIFVPFYLAEFLQDGPNFELMLDWLEKVRIRQDGPACMSGSCVFSKDISVDIDLCEYTDNTGRYFISFLNCTDHQVKVACAKHDGGEVPLNANSEPEQTITTIQNLCQTSTPTIESDCACDKRSWMLEFLANGVFEEGQDAEVTLLCIHTGDHRLRSWAHQEIVVTGASAPHRTLANPNTLANYIGWLIKESEKLATASTAKALKRGLSLAVITRSPLKDEIYDHLHSQEALDYFRFKRRKVSSVSQTEESEARKKFRSWEAKGQELIGELVASENVSIFKEQIQAASHA